MYINHLVEITCIDCDQVVFGTLNTKRCAACRPIWRKQYQRDRNGKRNRHTRKLFKAPEQIPKATLVTDKQVIAYIRAYMPDAYQTIIKKIEALYPDQQLLQQMGNVNAN